MRKCFSVDMKVRLACGAAGLAIVASPVYAQQDPAPDAATQGTTANDTTIVVTGSRIAREGYTAPTPITGISAEAIESEAATTIADVLFEVPSVRPARNPAATSQAAGNYVNLRGFGATRTLTLVDGKRFVPSNGAENSGGSSVDLNLIPEALVERLEIVTGGASAAWGSDAVGGVVNVILRDSLEGIRGKAQYGISDYGDAESVSLSLAAGSSFADGRGQFMFAGEYLSTFDQPRASDRPLGRDACGLFPGVVDGESYFAVPTCGLRHNAYTDGGVIVQQNGAPLSSSSPLYGRQFLNPNSSAPFDYGTIFPIPVPVLRGLSIGGDGIFKGADAAISAPLERKIVYGRMLYEISPSVEASFDLSYGESGTKLGMFVNSIPSSTDYPIPIHNGNPFIPDDIQQIMDNEGIDTIYLGRRAPELGYASTDSNNRVFRVVGGLEGEFGDGWSWDAYATYGRDWYDTTYGNNIIVSNLYAATDVVINPTTNQPDCRINVEGPASPGELAFGAQSMCVPANPFGPGSLASAADYILGELVQNSIYTQKAGGASVSGDPFSTWAGPVSVVLGVEYRHEEVVQVVSDYAEFINEPVFASGGFQQSNPKGFSGSNEVFEGFGEIVVPLLADMPLAQSLDLNAALRVTDYSTSGTVTTWKVGATYEPIDGLLIRASRSRDIRAPSLFESFGSNTTYAQVNFPGAPSTPAVSPGRNNLDLSPEKADSIAVGVTMRDLLVPGLRLSVDFYDISLKDSIGKLGSQAIVDRCYGIGEADGFPPDQALCDLISFDGTSATIIDPFLNLGTIDTHGVEFDLSYDLPVGESFGNLNVRVLANYVAELLINSSGLNPVDTAGDQSGLPHWRGIASLNYDGGPFGASLQAEYIGPMTRNVLAGPGIFPDPTVDAVVYLDASLRYNIIDDGDRQLQFFANVDNLLDREPPFMSGSGSRANTSPPGTFAQFHQTTNSTFYDQIGRRYRFGIRFSY